MEQFDLLYQPWINAISLDGKYRQFSVIDILEQAHNLRKISEDSPVIECSVYRFIEAILLSFLEVNNDRDWEKHWSNNKFSQDFIDKVKTELEGKLDLFSKINPFFQNLNYDNNEQRKQTSYLFKDLPSGTNGILKMKQINDYRDFCPICCAKGMIAEGSFAQAGGSGIHSGISGIPPIYVMPEGNTLYETLMLNYILPIFNPVKSTDESAVWDKIDIDKSLDREEDISLSMGLTYPNRSINLFNEDIENPVVCNYCGNLTRTRIKDIIYKQGWSRSHKISPWKDPWVAYRSDKEEIRAVVANKSRPDLWRDFSSLFLQYDNHGGFIGAPAVLQQFRYLLEEELISEDTNCSFTCYSLLTDGNAKSISWHTNSFNFKEVIIKNIDLAILLTNCLKNAENYSGLLKKGTKLVTIARKKSLKDKSINKFADKSIQNNYWQNLELCFKNILLDSRLQDETKYQEIADEWDRQAYRLFKNTFSQYLDTILPKNDMLKKAEMMMYINPNYKNKK